MRRHEQSAALGPTAIAMVVALCATTIAAPPSPGGKELEVGKAERLLVIAPHPDDETLGAGGLVQRVLARGGSTRIAILTAGDGYLEGVEHESGTLRPRPADFVSYGELRMGEARAASRELGGDRIRIADLGFPDGGLRPLLHEHWKRLHAEISPATQASKPPYPDVVNRKLLYDGADLRAALVRLLRESQPTLIALSDPLDKHPDHSATGLFTLLAVRDWVAGADRPPERFPRLVAYLVHWPGWTPGTPGAPAPQAGARLALPDDLAMRRLGRAALSLTAPEVATKGRALACHASQQQLMPELFAAFSGPTEPFSLLDQRDVEEAERTIEAGGH